MATEDGNATAKPTELGPEVFDDFDAFLKQAIRDYYDRGWKSRRGNFIALVIASGQAMSMAADSVKDGTGLKKAALGRGGRGRAAHRPALRAVGPARDHPDRRRRGVARPATSSSTRRRSREKVGAYRTLIAETRARFEEAQGGYRAGRYDAASRNLMVDGLLKRFLEEIDAAKLARARSRGSRYSSISDLRPPTGKRTSRLERSTFSILPRPYSGWTMISPAL